MSNKNLHTAKTVKNDEFYTQLSDIDKEVKYYKDYFRGKVVYCNCDNPISSNFTKYFILNFRFLGLKKLICTFYDVNNIKKAYAFVYDGQDLNGDGRITEDDIEIIRQLKAYQVPLSDDPGFIFEEKEKCESRGIYGSGDFRSKNCIEYLKLSDVVITNPPFSLFREYVAQLMEYDKKFLIIGNMNAITFKEIFPLIKDNKLWLGITKVYEFIQPDASIKKFGNIYWYTNIEHKKHHEPITLYKQYSDKLYPKYDNYDAIECSKVANIPVNFDGVIGVPITFIERYCPEQFEIIWQASGNTYANAPKDILEKLKFDPTIKYGGGLGSAVLNGKAVYTRILIRRKR